MKIIETLTYRQKIDILRGLPTGIFSHLFHTSPYLNQYAGEMCKDYYLSRSGEKTISPTYEKVIEMVDSFTEIVDTPENILASLISEKFSEKWDRIYSTLTENYNAIENNFNREVKTANNDNTYTYNSNKNKIGNNSDTTTFDTNVVDDGKTGSHKITTRNTDNQDNIFGFNSANAVGDTTSEEEVQETVIGDANKNTNYNSQTKTGTESKLFGISEEEKHTGSDTTHFDVDESVNTNGRNASGASLVNEEIEMRKKQIFFDIVYADIDSILTLKIYI